MDKKRRILSPDEVEESNNTLLNINLLPEEILLKIFNYLSKNDLGKIARVCKQWNNLTKSPMLWKIVDVTFFHHHASQSKVATNFIDVLPSCTTHIRFNFNSLLHWKVPLDFQDVSEKLHRKCPNVETLHFENARLSYSFLSIINLCAQFLKNVRLLGFCNCTFTDSLINKNYGGIFKVEALHLRSCSLISKPPFSKMPCLITLNASNIYDDDVGSWFVNDTTFLEKLEVLNLSHTRFGSETFQRIWNQGFNLTELYLCHTDVNDSDLHFNSSVNVLPCLKIICLGWSDVTVTGILSLVQSCQSLEKVYVNHHVYNAESSAACPIVSQSKVEIIALRRCYHVIDGNYYSLYK